MKKPLVWILVIVVLGVAYYLISPLWRVKVADEPSPVDAMNNDGAMEEDNDGQRMMMKTGMEDMTEEEKATMMMEMEKMEGEVMEKMEMMPKQAAVVSEADFVAAAHDVAGKALLIEDGGEMLLRFEDFETVNGPDLRIYLAADTEGKDKVDLGPIRATKGNVNYVIPEGTDTEKYHYVLVWCRMFQVLFSYADL